MWRLRAHPNAPSKTASRIAIGLKGLLLFFPLGFLGWFLTSYFVLSGTYVTETDFCSKSNAFSPMLPWDQVGKIETNEGCSQPLYGPMMTFDVKAPRWFEKVKIEVEFDPHDQPVMDFALRRRDLITLDPQPMLSSVLDDPRWMVQEQHGLKFYQKQKKYSGLEAFLKDEVALQTQSIGTFHYTLPTPNLLPDYVPRPDHRIHIDKTLRGSHRFSIYLKDEPLDLKISKQDLNAYAGRDPLLIKISLFGELVDTIVVEDDGNDLGGGNARGPIQTVQLFKDAYPEGSYEIELLTNDDVLIRSIDSGHDRLVFHDRLFLADNVEYFPDLDAATQTTTLFTDANPLFISTPHEHGLQTIGIDRGSLEVKRVNNIYRVEDLAERSKLMIPKNDVILESNSLFAFSLDQWFAPIPDNVFPLLQDSTPTFDSLEYAIARPASPEVVGSNLTSTHEFELQPFLSNDFKIRANLLFPGIDVRKSQVDLYRIRATFTKPPVTLKNAWERGMSVLRRSL